MLSLVKIFVEGKICLCTQHMQHRALVGILSGLRSEFFFVSSYDRTTEQNEMTYASELSIDFYRFNTIMMTDRIRAWISNRFLWISWLPPSGLTNNISLVIAYVASRFLNKK